MEEEKIRIVYVDDQLDASLSHYLNVEYKAEEYQESSLLGPVPVVKMIDDVEFDEECNFEKLLKDVRIRTANILIIDERLFEEHRGSSRYSGAQFRLILRNCFPYIETFVITQKAIPTGANMLQKYSGPDAGQEAIPYYEECLKAKLDQAIKNVLEFRALSKQLNLISDDSDVLHEQIWNSLYGDNAYRALTGDDIDHLVKAFEEMAKHEET